MYEAIEANRLRSLLLIGSLGGLLALIGFALLETAEPGTGIVGMLLGFLLAGVLGVLAWLAGGSIFLATSGAKSVAREAHPQLHNVVEEMAIAAGLPKPSVYLMDDPSPNAFATGRSPSNAAIAVTDGLLARLTRSELQGVIAHELGHIQNRDILFMTIAGVLVGAIAAIASMCEGIARSSDRRRSRDDKDGAGAFIIVAFLVALFARPLSRILYLAASRSREYLADATAALLTRYPEGLASALEKIAAHPSQLQLGEAAAAMCIVNPLQNDAHSGEWLAGVFSTHPPTSKRVAVLRRMTGLGDYASYERAYRETIGGRVLPRSTYSAPSVQPRTTGISAASLVAPDSPAESYRTARDLMRDSAGYGTVRCQECDTRLRIPPKFNKPAARCPKCKSVVQLGR